MDMYELLVNEQKLLDEARYIAKIYVGSSRVIEVPCQDYEIQERCTKLVTKNRELRVIDGTIIIEGVKDD